MTTLFQQRPQSSLHFWPKGRLFHNRRRGKEVPAELHPLSYVNEVNGGAPVTAGRWTPIRELADGRQLCLRLCRQEVFEEPCQLLQWCKEKGSLSLLSRFDFIFCVCVCVCLSERVGTCAPSLLAAGDFLTRAMLRTWGWICSNFSPLPGWAHESPFQSDGFMDSRIS